ncbi:MAG: hypothetical protein H0V89_14390 [Deltaproteobacteria bacterium]|nr:hypothetical protein [Deltaproteobacteria bacterium]
MLLALLACATDPLPEAADDTGLDLPTHSECLPAGEAMDEATCRAVVAHDGRQPTTSLFKAGVEPPIPESRDDADLAWLTAEAQRCTCSCCHTAGWGGPGVHAWDLAFDGVWLDSASDWSLRVFSGMELSEDQRLPTDDPDRLLSLVGRELERRQLARE